MPYFDELFSYIGVMEKRRRAGLPILVVSHHDEMPVEGLDKYGFCVHVKLEEVCDAVGVAASLFSMYNPSYYFFEESFLDEDSKKKVGQWEKYPILITDSTENILAVLEGVDTFFGDKSGEGL